MHAPRARFALCLGMLTLSACGDPADPSYIGVPSFAPGGVGRPSVLVNPNSDDEGTAKTIQEGIDIVAEGGKVLVVPGTYAEALVINKGLTLEAIGGESGPVTIVTPPGLTTATIQVATQNPVTIRDVSMQVSSQNGILAQGVFDLTLERLTMVRTAVTSGTNRLVRPENNGSARARLVVRNSAFDAGGLPRTLAISIAAQLDGLIEGNVIRRAGASCIFLVGRSAAGINAINVDVVNNDLDECALLENYAIEVGPIAMPGGPTGMVGVVNIIGNTIRNTGGSCTPTNAIRYELYAGRIERNSIVKFLQDCAQATVLALPAAIWVGSLREGFTPSSPVVRFNDIAGNAHAGLRVAPNITTSIDARCNWWGSPSGPSSVGPGTGQDAIVVETGAATPTYMPFATAPIAETDATGC